MNYEAWRITFQSSEQAARAAFEQLSQASQQTNTVCAEAKSYIASIETMNTRHPIHIESDDEPVHIQRDEWVEYIKERTADLKRVLEQVQKGGAS